MTGNEVKPGGDEVRDAREKENRDAQEISRPAYIFAVAATAL
jgi:hypothetical protein